jgi:hypothetical protein
MPAGVDTPGMNEQESFHIPSSCFDKKYSMPPYALPEPEEPTGFAWVCRVVWGLASCVHHNQDAVAAHDVLDIALMLFIALVLLMVCLEANKTRNRPQNAPQLAPVIATASTQTDLQDIQNVTPRRESILETMRTMDVARDALSCDFDYQTRQIKQQKDFENFLTKQMHDTDKMNHYTTQKFLFNQTAQNDQRIIDNLIHFNNTTNYLQQASCAEFQQYQQLNHAEQHKFDMDMKECMQDHFRASSEHFVTFRLEAQKRAVFLRSLHANIEETSGVVHASMISECGL